MRRGFASALASVEVAAVAGGAVGNGAGVVVAASTEVNANVSRTASPVPMRGFG
jgi:hypothetical protein